MLNQTGGKNTDSMVDKVETMKDGSAGTFGNKLAAGLAFPTGESSGMFRAEIEWGMFAPAKIQSVGTKLIFEGVPYLGDDLTRGTNEFGVSTYFINVYYDLRLGSDFSLYFGVGGGAANIKATTNYALLDGYDYNADPDYFLIDQGGGATNFGWNAALGLGYSLTDRLTLDFGYRYVSLGSVTAVARYGEIGQVYAGKAFNKTSLSMHDVSLGLRYMF